VGALNERAELRGTHRARRWAGMTCVVAGSPAETVARLRMNDAGLYPEAQVRLVAPTGRVAYPDFLFRASGLVVEIEGYRWHGSRAQHQRDTTRFNDLSACPEVRRILRFTAAECLSPSGGGGAGRQERAGCGGRRVSGLRQSGQLVAGATIA
jgi:hypothetical protein